MWMSVELEDVVGKCCEEEMVRTGEEGVDIDDQAGLEEAHVLATPVPSHLTCLKHGKMVGETSFPC